MRRRLLENVVPFAALLVGVNVTVPVQASGYWNMPGNFCQCWGYGWGGGYHACLVLGPTSCGGFCTHNLVRVPHAPRPPYECRGVVNGCYSNDDDGAYQQVMAEPVGPRGAPMSARPLFDPPVEQ
ncbi:MAG: hypothetical protein L0228_19835 [Planctomycetes bacterium]|nr:hypothetical protein [Planctomycetota bacterium]